MKTPDDQTLKMERMAQEITRLTNDRQPLLDRITKLEYRCSIYRRVLTELHLPEPEDIIRGEEGGWL